MLCWLCCPDSPRRPDAATYDITIAGFCRFGDPRSALVALGKMASDGVPPSLELQEAVWDAMVQDARIEEAWALEEAMRPPESKKPGTKAARQVRELRVREREKKKMEGGREGERQGAGTAWSWSPVAGRRRGEEETRAGRGLREAKELGLEWLLPSIQIGPCRA